MPRSLTKLAILLLGGTFATVVRAQGQPTPTPVPEPLCSACHTCDRPTPKSLCLRGCNRGSVGAVANGLTPGRIPDVIILNELEDLYLPVPFDHKGHADMAGMTKGCVVCHHYTGEGVTHPACKTCHEVAPPTADMRKPGLKGAYHRQCLACHREWSHETACEICHAPKAGRGLERGISPTPTKDDIVGQMHPPIPEPETTIYKTKYKQVPGTNVTFRHKEHIHRFGYSCAECHREDSCSRCHEEGKSEAGRPKTLEEHHNPCATCHDMEAPDRCDHCHWSKAGPEPPRFDHARTGWTLSRFHSGANCRVCHRTLRFVALDRACQECHADWSQATFDHKVTGQSLDETHAEIDCAECHADRAFDRPPTCVECHEEEEGIVFPGQRPGPVDASLDAGK